MHVLLTRPTGENEGLDTLLQSAGYTTTIRPMIELVPAIQNEARKATAMNLDQWDQIIFVSKSAVRFGMPLLDSYWPQWPHALNWFAVGAGTAAELETYNVRASYPETAGSEGLLQLPGLTRIEGANVLIVRGAGGRELLAETLTARGATVTYWEIYERQLQRYADWASTVPGIVIVTSVEALQNLISQPDITASAWSAVVASERIAAHPDALRFGQVANAGGASDQAMYDAVVKLSNEIRQV